MASSTRKFKPPSAVAEGKPLTSVRVSDDVVDQLAEIRCFLIVHYSARPDQRPEGFDGALTTNDVLRTVLSVFCRDYGISMPDDPKGGAA